MVYRMELTYDETVDIFETKCNAGSNIGYTLPRSINESCDFNLMLKSLVPNEVRVNNTIYDIRLRSNLTNKKTIRFKKSFFLQNKMSYSIKLRSFDRSSKRIRSNNNQNI